MRSPRQVGGIHAAGIGDEGAAKGLKAGLKRCEL